MRYLESTITLRYDAALCNGCALCVRVCPHAVFAMVDKRAVLADRGACMECGACAKNCEQDAIDVEAGVGCAAGLLESFVTGRAPSKDACGCSGSSSGCC